MSETFLIADEGAMQAMGRRLASMLRVGDVIAIEGPLGAGKTTLARGMLEGLGHEGEVPSPSFAIVQPYDVPMVSLPVAHVDLYRIDDPADVTELALDEYLMDGALFIEWPERLGDRIWPQALRLQIFVEEGGVRRLTVTTPDAWKGRWLP